jgi:hypothetical protein
MIYNYANWLKANQILGANLFATKIQQNFHWKIKFVIKS